MKRKNSSQHGKKTLQKLQRNSRGKLARNAKRHDLVDLFKQKRPEIKKEVIVIEDNEPLHSSSLCEPLKRKYSQITASSNDENQRKDLMLS